MTTARPRPSASGPRPSGTSGVHGDWRAARRPTSGNGTTGRGAATARATAARPVGRAPITFSAVSTVTNTTTRSQRSRGVIAGYQNRAYSTKSAGYTATSTKLSTQLHQPTWNAQNGPNARRVHVT